MMSVGDVAIDNDIIDLLSVKLSEIPSAVQQTVTSE